MYEPIPSGIFTQSGRCTLFHTRSLTNFRGPAVLSYKLPHTPVSCLLTLHPAPPLSWFLHLFLSTHLQLVLSLLPSFPLYLSSHYLFISSLCHIIPLLSHHCPFCGMSAYSQRYSKHTKEQQGGKRYCTVGALLGKATYCVCIVLRVHSHVQCMGG